MMSILIIALAIALIGGATSAWFTAEADLPEAEFKAGTVKVNVDNGVVKEAMEGKSFDNVNPGDCGSVKWKIVNKGTKDAELRVKLTELWDGDLPTRNFFYAPAPDSKWVLYEDRSRGNKGLWLYYTGGPVKGDFNEDDEEARTVDLELIVAFDGEKTNNDYQGKTFTLSGDVEAVQTSNGAPAAVWGEAWKNATAEGYEPRGLARYYVKYIEGTKCWNKENGEEPEEPEEPVAKSLKSFELDPNDSEIKITGGGKKILIKTKIINAVDEYDKPFNGEIAVEVWHADFQNEIQIINNVNITNGVSNQINTGSFNVETDSSIDTSKSNIIVQYNSILGQMQ